MPHPHHACSLKDLILALAAQRDFIDITARNCCVEADPRERFYRPRIIRAKHSEWCVRRAEAKFDVFMNKWGGEDPDLEQTEEFGEILDGLDRALEKNSRIFEEDCRAAQADVPDQYFMDNVYRPLTEGRGHRAPNGEMLVEYGRRGEPVKQSWATIRASDDDLFRHIFLHKLMDHFKDYIYIPSWTLYNKALRRNKDPPQGLGGRSIHLVVTAVECIIFVACRASSVTLLSCFNSIKSRIITASLYSLAFPYVVVFFSKEAKGMFMLILAFWGVMAVFVVASSSMAKYT